MKQHYTFAAVLGVFVIVLFLAVFASWTSGVTASANQTPTAYFDTSEEADEEPIKTPENIPTSHPPPTDGPALPEIPIPTLERPLGKNQALQKALEYDRTGVALWDNPWSLTTLATEPNRIQAELVSLQTLESRIGRFPDMNDDESVWKITIHGPVRLYGVGWSCKCSGVTYLIWPKTGEIFGTLSEGPVLEKGYGRGGSPIVTRVTREP